VPAKNPILLNANHLFDWHKEIWTSPKHLIFGTCKRTRQSVLPKYEPKIAKISALQCGTVQGEIITTFGSYFGRNNDFINSF
jgi:hypothetical protein